MRTNKGDFHSFFKVVIRLSMNVLTGLITHWKIDICVAILVIAFANYYEPIRRFIQGKLSHEGKTRITSMVPHLISSETKIATGISELSYNRDSLNIMGYTFRLTLVKTIPYIIDRDESFKVVVRADASGRFPDISDIDIHGAIAIKITNNQNVQLAKLSPVFHKSKSGSWRQEPVSNDAQYETNLEPGVYNIVIEGIFYGSISEPSLKAIIEIWVFRPP